MPTAAAAAAAAAGVRAASELTTHLKQADRVAKHAGNTRGVANASISTATTLNGCK
jgi:hypothetical protein